MALTTPEHVDAIIQQAEQEVTLSSAQKEALKQKTTEVIGKFTEAQIGDFRSHLMVELKAQAVDGKDGTPKDAKLEDDEIGEAVTAASDKSKTPEAVPPAPTGTTDTSASTPGTEGSEAEKKITSSRGGLGRMIVEMFPSIKNFVENFMRKGYSFEEEDAFEGEDIDGKKIADAVKALGVDVPDAGKPRDKIGQYTIEHLAKLKIPTEKGIDFFEYMAGTSRRTPPTDLAATFDSAKAHYATLSDPKTIADIFNFSVQEAPIVPPPENTPTPPETAPTNNTIDIALDGGKTEKIEAKAEDFTNFNGIRSSAETVLGTKDAKIEEKLKAAYLAQKENYDKAGDKKPEEATKILKNVADQLTAEITTKIGITKIEDKDKKADLDPLKLKEYTLAGLQDSLKVYFPLAFNQIYTRTEKAIDEKKDITKEAATMLKESLIGYLREPGKTGATIFTEKTQQGHEKVVAQLLQQEAILKNLNGSTDYWKGITSSNASPLLKIA